LTWKIKNQKKSLNINFSRIHNLNIARDHFPIMQDICIYDRKTKHFIKDIGNSISY